MQLFHFNKHGTACAHPSTQLSPACLLHGISQPPQPSICRQLLPLHGPARSPEPQDESGRYLREHHVTSICNGTAGTTAVAGLK